MEMVERGITTTQNLMENFAVKIERVFKHRCLEDRKMTTIESSRDHNL